ncbi:Receptor-like protein kinase FERONIA [Acorus calamus]|uniref:Receptor-like protein kinase FERONIA n=1 Tax=Acorus calamus TaxID=4465 RepID=A0AAV9C409_ACOCL|nr:Receptor-like protein kinase FERONIA [Acorus calamus]
MVHDSANLRYRARNGNLARPLFLPEQQTAEPGKDEIKTATKDFSELLVIGVGGFGKVYRGEIDGGSASVAVKRGSRLSNQGVHEF